MAQWNQAWQFLVLLAVTSHQTNGSAALLADDVCPQPCSCIANQPGQIVIQCIISSHSQWEITCRKLEYYATQFQRIDLRIHGNSNSFSSQLSCLPEIENLDFSRTNLVIKNNTFYGLAVKSTLNISRNGIKNLPEGIFSGLNQISELDLSYNELSTLDSHIFQNLTSLRSLDIGFNSLDSSAVESLSFLPVLEEVNLEYNRLQYLFALHLPASIKSLNLRGNLLSAISVGDSIAHPFPLQNVLSLDISHNPLDCSCDLQKLALTVPNLKSTLRNSLETVCNTPPTLHGQRLQKLNISDFPCSVPKNLISYPSNQKDVHIYNSITLECQAQGYPKPAIMWITPWNDIFFNTSQLLWHNEDPQSLEAEKYSMYKKYQEPNVFLVSHLRLTENNELSITNIRGSMSGNFTCFAINAAGNTSVDIELTCYSSIKDVYIYSTIMGGYFATAFLLFGFFVGFVKMVVVWLRRRFCFSIPIFSKPSSVEQASDIGSITDIPEVQEGKPNSQSPSSETNESNSPLMAYERDFGDFQTSDTIEDIDDPDCTASKRPYNSIFEEAKGRLRYGVGRKMELVRKNVQSIKESGSVYMHNIVESGSSAANRMKAGVALGVETVKYHVQSFKELCGTGDMGAQTISMVSVETDVDSHQQKEIVKQITFV